MILRFLARFVRGPARPRQLHAATILGAAIAFVPDTSLQLGWTIALGVLLLASGANLPLAALVWLPARLVALVAMPLSFAVGRFLLDGPTSGLFRALVNAPVAALLGFEYYALTGGLPFAIVLGVLAGGTVVRLVRGLRRRVDGLQEGSEAWRRVIASWPVRVLNWILGGDWRRAEEPRGFRVPVRPLVALAVVALGAVAVRAAPGPLLRPMIAGGLEAYNGATVDLERVELDLAAGRMSLVGLALADPADLDRDLFATDRMEADLSTGDLLRKRFTIDRLVSREARQGTLRETRGELVGAPEEAEPDARDPDDGEGGTIDDWVEDYRVWKERLAQLREWLEKIAGPPAEEEAEDPESMRERLEREAREKGWGAVAARHLREGAPTVLISELVVDGLVSEELEGDPLDVRGENLSTHPRLADGAPRVSVRSRSGRIDFEVVLAGSPASGGEADAAPGRVALAWRRLATDDVLGRLRLSGEPIVSGGTLDLDLRGAWSGGDVGRVDLPLRVTVRDALWRIGGSDPTPVEELVVPFGLRGPIDDPRISFDAGDLESALVEAGKAGLARRLEAEAGEELDDLFRKGEETLGEELDPELKEGAKDLLKGLFGDD